MIVGIDFGTHGTAIAFALIGSKEVYVEQVTRPPLPNLHPPPLMLQTLNIGLGKRRIIRRNQNQNGLGTPLPLLLNKRSITLHPPTPFKPQISSSTKTKHSRLSAPKRKPGD